jgi:hypothetical protein
MSTTIVDLQRSVASVLNGNQQIVGTCFAVSDRFILTCAHVVTAAGGTPGSVINIKFYGRSEICSVLVSGEYWKSEEDGDIAVLYLKEGLPSSIKPVKLSISINSHSHPFRAFGYPSRKNTGIEGGWAIGIIAGAFEYNGRTILQIESSNPTRGMSGSPVFDETLGSIVGMISEVYYAGPDGKNRDSVFAIPSDILIDQFEKILPDSTTLPTAQDVEAVSTSSLRPKSKLTLDGTDYIIQTLIAQKSFGNMVVRAARAGDKLMQENVGICQIEFKDRQPEIQKDIHRNLRRFQNINNAANSSKHLGGIRKIVPPSINDLWVICQWINGSSLSDFYPTSGPLPTKSGLRQLLAYSIDVCSGLAELHRFREMHLGVMEDTIIIHRSFGAVLIDPCFVGKPIPIRADQQLFDPRIDIFALGAVLYRIMTHKMPHMQPPSKINPAIPPPLDQILNETLSGSIREALDLKRELVRVRGKIIWE